MRKKFKFFLKELKIVTYKIDNKRVIPKGEKKYSVLKQLTR